MLWLNWVLKLAVKLALEDMHHFPAILAILLCNCVSRLWQRFESWTNLWPGCFGSKNVSYVLTFGLGCIPVHFAIISVLILGCSMHVSSTCSLEGNDFILNWSMLRWMWLWYPPHSSWGSTVGIFMSLLYYVLFWFSLFLCYLIDEYFMVSCAF